tara:strand:- start:699 stop:1385 length:687 start_codon:yes stop_codon:yes gene_type:complete
MKNTTIIQKALAIGFIIVLSFTSAYAHSSHDHSNLPLKWNFSDATKAKVLEKMNSEKWSGSVGLSRLEQKILSNYGIHVGNSFNSMLNEKSLLIKRTSLGIKVIETEGVLDMTHISEVPFRRSNAVSKVSMNRSHSGHDHKILNKEWMFTSKTEAKIDRNIQKASYPIFVGLSSHQRNAMEAYGIKTGNLFRTQIAGQDLLVTRSSGGIMIEKASSIEVASLNNAGAM